MHPCKKNHGIVIGAVACRRFVTLAVLCGLLLAPEVSASLVYIPEERACSTGNSLALVWNSVADVDSCLSYNRSLVVSRQTIVAIFDSFAMSLNGPMRLEQGAYVIVQNASVKLHARPNASITFSASSTINASSTLALSHNSNISCNGGSVAIEEGSNVTLLVLKPTDVPLENFTVAPFTNCSSVSGEFARIIVKNASVFTADGQPPGDSDSEDPEETVYTGGTSCYRTLNYAFQFIARDHASCSQDTGGGGAPDTSPPPLSPPPPINIGPIDGLEPSTPAQQPAPVDVNQSQQPPSDDSAPAPASTVPAESSDMQDGAPGSGIPGSTVPPSSATTPANSTDDARSTVASTNVKLIAAVVSGIAAFILVSVAAALVLTKWPPARKLVLPHRDRREQDHGVTYFNKPD